MAKPAKRKRAQTRKAAAKGGESVRSRARSRRPQSLKNQEREHPLGRPLLYSPAVVQAICALVSQLVPIATACRLHGISKATFYNWRRRAQLGEAPFVGMLAEVERALALAESTIVQSIVTSAEDNWRAAAWLLERRFPKRYGLKQTVQLEKKPADMSDDEIDAELLRLGYEKRDAGGSADEPDDAGELRRADLERAVIGDRSV